MTPRPSPPRGALAVDAPRSETGRSLRSDPLLTALVIDDDRDVRSFLIALLSSFGYAVTAVAKGQDGIRAALLDEPDVVLLDLRLPDLPGAEVLSALRSHLHHVPVIVVSGFLDVDRTVDIIKRGAVDALEKPLRPARLRKALSTVLATHGRRRNRSHVHGVAARWARLVIDACRADRDFRTIGDWSRLAGHSAGSTREICRLVGIPPHDARDFARMLNAVLRCARHQCALSTLLDVGDRRTLERLLRRAGMKPESVPTIDEYFSKQQFVGRETEALQTLRTLLAPRA